MEIGLVEPEAGVNVFQAVMASCPLSCRSGKKLDHPFQISLHGAAHWI
jgi:hypothetical protein